MVHCDLTDLHIGNQTTTNNQDRLLSNQTLGIHEVNNLIESVHVLVDFPALDDLPGDGNGVVTEVLVDGLLVDTSNVCGLKCQKPGGKKTRRDSLWSITIRTRPHGL